MPSSDRPLLAALTSARFFAAFHIVLFHASAMRGLTRAPSWFQQFSSVGYVAVTFFFLLSGFVLVYTYAGKELDLRQFWRARLARLYPVYLFSLLLAAPFFFYVVLKFNIPQFSWLKAHLGLSVMLVLTMQQAWFPLAALAWNGVAWAVSVEVFFYILFPVLLRRFLRMSIRGLVTVCLTAWMLALAVALLYVVLAPDHVVADSTQDFLFWLSIVKFNPLVRLPEFLVGMACGVWFIRGSHSPKLATPLVLGGTALALTITAFSHQLAYPILHTGLYAPAFAAVICGLALRPRWTSFLESRWLLLLGQSSYALFLLHAMILGTAMYWDAPPPSSTNRFAPPPVVPSMTRVLVGVLLATLLAVVVFKLIEEPARKWLRGKPSPKSVSLQSAA